MPCFVSILYELNRNANLLLVVVTLVLVVITAWYAYYTSQMAATMAKQVIAEIEVFDVAIVSPSLGEIRECIARSISASPYEPCQMVLTVGLALRNKSCANGSIDKPVLKLSLSNTHGPELKIRPTTKELRYDNDSRDRVTIDLGQTIQVSGGGMARVDIKYNVLLSEGLARRYHTSITDLRYFLEYTDNVGQSYQVPVSLEPRWDISVTGTKEGPGGQPFEEG